MPRGIWSGTISFGLVAIPVSVVPAVRESRISFHQLHSEDYARLQREMLCPQHGRTIHPEHIVRGFEYEQGKFIEVTDEEFESLAPKWSQSIAITDFVALDAIDPLYYDRPYYLIPQNADKPYSLLVEALAKAKKAGIAKFVMRGSEYLCAVREIDGALCLFTLNYQADIVPYEEFVVSAKAEKKEESFVEKQINEMSGKFQPHKYKDEYAELVSKLIEAKVKASEKITVPATGEEEAAEEPSEEEVDLVAALEESLARARGSRKK